MASRNPGGRAEEGLDGGGLPQGNLGQEPGGQEAAPESGAGLGAQPDGGTITPPDEEMELWLEAEMQGEWLAPETQGEARENQDPRSTMGTPAEGDGSTTAAETASGEIRLQTQLANGPWLNGKRPGRGPLLSTRQWLAGRGLLRHHDTEESAAIVMSEFIDLEQVARMQHEAGEDPHPEETAEMLKEAEENSPTAILKAVRETMARVRDLLEACGLLVVVMFAVAALGIGAAVVSLTEANRPHERVMTVEASVPCSKGMCAEAAVAMAIRGLRVGSLAPADTVTTTMTPGPTACQCGTGDGRRMLLTLSRPANWRTALPTTRSGWMRPGPPGSGPCYWQRGVARAGNVTLGYDTHAWDPETTTTEKRWRLMARGKWALEEQFKSRAEPAAYNDKETGELPALCTLRTATARTHIKFLACNRGTWIGTNPNICIELINGAIRMCTNLMWQTGQGTTATLHGCVRRTEKGSDGGKVAEAFYAWYGSTRDWSGQVTTDCDTKANDTRPCHFASNGGRWDFDEYPPPLAKVRS